MAARHRGESCEAFRARQEMMRPPPGGVPPHRPRASSMHSRKIANSSRGRSGRIAKLSAGAEGGAAAGGCAEAAGAPGAIAASAVRQRDETSALLRSRHCSASGPPGATPEQCEMKSERQAARMAPICWCVGRLAGAAAGGGGVPAGLALRRLRAEAARQALAMAAGVGGAATAGAATAAAGAPAPLPGARRQGRSPRHGRPAKDPRRWL